MKQWQVLKTVFPEVLTENFEFVNFEEQSDRLDYWLDERGICHGRIIKGERCVSTVSPMNASYRIFLYEVRLSICMSGDAGGAIPRTAVSSPMIMN